MYGVTRWHVWRHRIRNAELRKRIRLETLDFYVELRQLRWAGHVARMGYERTPRKFLTSWVAHPRATSVHVRTLAELDTQTRGPANGLQEMERDGAEPRSVARAHLRTS